MIIFLLSAYALPFLPQVQRITGGKESNEIFSIIPAVPARLIQ
jgi:hypothetical protein